MASLVYNTFKAKLMAGDIDLDGDTINVALVTNSYVPDEDTDEFFDDISNEVSANGYTANGATLLSATVTVDTDGDTGVFDAADVTWATSTITARGAVLYKSTGEAGTSPLIAYVDFGENKVSDSGDFTISWNASGIMTLA